MENAGILQCSEGWNNTLQTRERRTAGSSTDTARTVPGGVVSALPSSEEALHGLFYVPVLHHSVGSCEHTITIIHGIQLPRLGGPEPWPTTVLRASRARASSNPIPTTSWTFFAMSAVSAVTGAGEQWAPKQEAASDQPTHGQNHGECGTVVWHPAG